MHQHQKLLNTLVPVIPRFTRILKDQHVMEHGTAEFICDVYPENAPLTWMSRGKEVVLDSLKFDASTAGKTRRLLIHDSKEEDAGTVSAVLGENDSHAELYVEGTYSSILIGHLQLVSQQYNIHISQSKHY